MLDSERKSRKVDSIRRLQSLFRTWTNGIAFFQSTPEADQSRGSEEQRSLSVGSGFNTHITLGEMRGPVVIGGILCAIATTVQVHTCTMLLPDTGANHVVGVCELSRPTSSTIMRTQDCWTRGHLPVKHTVDTPLICEIVP